MLDEFYALREWDQDGKPTESIAKKLEIEEYL
ncbi:MAG: hypothetical protein GY801_27060 [bacterium]|nr:hypothetical protein [bacterium]